MNGLVTAVCRHGAHEFSKPQQESITLLAGLGVEGDAHMGATVKHRSRVARDPSQPNLRQVHLIHNELFDQLASAGYTVRPGELGENITTSGIDLLGLPTGTLLHIGDDAVVEVTGLRNPCTQIDDYQQGLLKHVAHRSNDGTIIRKSGVMGIVQAGGVVGPGDQISAVLPSTPHRPLEPV
ncbi:MAG: MOSC domain-containing protein [Actinomycetota bacterium]